MKKKILFWSVIVIVASTVILFLVLDYMEYKSDQNDDHLRWTQNCEPGGIHPAVMVENDTHTFDLGNCTWHQKDN